MNAQADHVHHERAAIRTRPSPIGDRDWPSVTVGEPMCLEDGAGRADQRRRGFVVGGECPACGARGEFAVWLHMLLSPNVSAVVRLTGVPDEAEAPVVVKPKMATISAPTRSVRFMTTPFVQPCPGREHAQRTPAPLETERPYAARAGRRIQGVPYFGCPDPTCAPHDRVWSEAVERRMIGARGFAPKACDDAVRSRA